jgi:hypothetical protein
MNKETEIITNFVRKGTTPFHSIYSIKSLSDFIEVCQDHIFDNTNETQKELIAASLNKVDWDVVAIADLKRKKERKEEKQEETANIPF